MADALVSPAVGGAMWAASAGLIGYSSKKLKEELDDRKVPLMGVVAAFTPWNFPYNQAIRKVTPTGQVTTFAGTLGMGGSTDGTGPAARFNFPLAPPPATYGQEALGPISDQASLSSIGAVVSRPPAPPRKTHT